MYGALKGRLKSHPITSELNFFVLDTTNRLIMMDKEQQDQEKVMTLVKESANMITFNQFKASKKLAELAKHPFDMTKPGNLTPDRFKKYCASACGYKLFYGTERVTDEVIETLASLAHEAQVFQQMDHMQSGGVVNYIDGFPSENRPALHTATRDFFEKPNRAAAAANATQLAKKEVEKLKAFIQQIDKENRFTDLITIGIGGSDLGPRAHYIALQYLHKPGRNVHFISNIDPDDVSMALHGIDLKKTLVLVISKTGTTLETMTNEELVRSFFTKAGLKSEEHFLSVTMPGSPLDDAKKYRQTFYIWDWVGGRYSTSSMVGGVLLSFACGFDVYWEFLRGLNAMDKAALNKELHQNLPLLAALLGIWNRNFLHHQTLAVIPYSQPLSRYAAHIQQLDMESHGKRIDQHGRTTDFDTGPIIWGEVGTSSQHSFFQLLHQGTTVVPMEFISYRENQWGFDQKYEGTTSQQKLLSNLFAQAIGLATGQTNDNPNKVFPGNRPSHILLGKQLTPYSLGVLLAFFEHKIAFQGFIWKINSFDQEGVQLGKVLANKIIGRFAKPEGTAYPLADALIQHLNTL